jgi:hypothetical protein
MKKLTTLLILLATIATNLNATVRYVKMTGTTAANAAAATTWATACRDLQAVINISVNGDEIWVAAGTYKPNSIVSTNGSENPTLLNNRDYDFVLKQGVKIYGGLPSNAKCTTPPVQTLCIASLLKSQCSQMTNACKPT